MLQNEFLLNRLLLMDHLKIKAYLESGILELYVLDQLSFSERIGVEEMIFNYPVLKNELAEIELALENFATVNAVMPAANLADITINNILKSENEQFNDFNELPLIHKFSDAKKWLDLINEIEMPPADNGKAVKVLRHDDRVCQMLVISSTDIEQETHENEYESFLILKGECKCVVGSEIRMMKAGDFMPIPLHALHHVEILGESVTAILQHVTV